MSRLLALLTAAAIFVAISAGLFTNRNLSGKLQSKLDTASDKIADLTATVAPQPTQIINGLPDRYLLEAVFVPQAPEKNWDQPWQDTCEEAALLTAVYYHQQRHPDLTAIKTDLLAMVEYENSQGWGHDINLSQMAAMVKDMYGIDSQIINQPTLKDLKTQLFANRPIVVPADGKSLFRENRHFRSGGPYYHNLTILGYDDHRHKFTVHDVGTQFGANFKYSYDLLIDSIHDLPVSGHKQDIKSGPARVLVLLQ